MFWLALTLATTFSFTLIGHSKDEATWFPQQLKHFTQSKLKLHSIRSSPQPSHLCFFFLHTRATCPKALTLQQSGDKNKSTDRLHFLSINYTIHPTRISHSRDILYFFYLDFPGNTRYYPLEGCPAPKSYTRHVYNATQALSASQKYTKSKHLVILTAFCMLFACPSLFPPAINVSNGFLGLATRSATPQQTALLQDKKRH